MASLAGYAVRFDLKVPYEQFRIWFAALAVMSAVSLFIAWKHLSAGNARRLLTGDLGSEALASFVVVWGMLLVAVLIVVRLHQWRTKSVVVLVRSDGVVLPRSTFTPKLTFCPYRDLVDAGITTTEHHYVFYLKRQGTGTIIIPTNLFETHEDAEAAIALIGDRKRQADERQMETLFT